MVPRRAGVVERRREMGHDIPPITPSIVVNRAEGMQGGQSPVDEAAKSVHLRRFARQEVLTLLGSTRDHGRHAGQHCNCNATEHIN
jgi:hypothetical protein